MLSPITRRMELSSSFFSKSWVSRWSLVADTVIVFSGNQDRKEDSPVRTRSRGESEWRFLRWWKGNHTVPHVTREVRKSPYSVWSNVNLWNIGERQEMETAVGDSWQFASWSESARESTREGSSRWNSSREEHFQTHRDQREHSNSNCTRKLLQELQNVGCTNHQHISNSFTVLAKEVGVIDKWLNICKYTN